MNAKVKDEDEQMGDDDESYFPSDNDSKDADDGDDDQTGDDFDDLADLDHVYKLRRIVRQGKKMTGPTFGVRRCYQRKSDWNDGQTPISARAQLRFGLKI